MMEPEPTPGEDEVPDHEMESERESALEVVDAAWEPEDISMPISIEHTIELT